MIRKTLVACSILPIISIVLTSCTTTLTQTSTLNQTFTTTITVLEVTNTRIVSPSEVREFINGARKVYDDTISGYSSLKPYPGIAGSGFLTLTVENETVISMDGVSYNYAAIDPIISDSWALPAEVTIGTYLIDFSLPNIVTSGGTPISVQIYNTGDTGQPFSTGFTYYHIPFQISNYSVYAEKYTEGELQFLFIYYYPPSFTQPENVLWLVLLPTG